MRLPSDLDVLRLRDFRRVFGASLVSLLGDGIVPVALSFAVLDLTGSATDLGLVLASETVALAVALLIGGVVADRVGRRRVMVMADLVRLVSHSVVGALLIAGNATVAEIAISEALLGAASGFFNPASSGLLPMLAGEHLQRANALVESRWHRGARGCGRAGHHDQPRSRAAGRRGHLCRQRAAVGAGEPA